MGLNPQLSGERSEDEGLFVRQHAYWADAMRSALAREKSGQSLLHAGLSAECGGQAA